MKLEKAIEILTTDNPNPDDAYAVAYEAALTLGIEALKRVIPSFKCLFLK